MKYIPCSSSAIDFFNIKSFDSYEGYMNMLRGERNNRVTIRPIFRVIRNAY